MAFEVWQHCLDGSFKLAMLRLLRHLVSNVAPSGCPCVSGKEQRRKVKEQRFETKEQRFRISKRKLRIKERRLSLKERRLKMKPFHSLMLSPPCSHTPKGLRCEMCRGWCRLLRRRPKATPPTVPIPMVGVRSLASVTGGSLAAKENPIRSRVVSADFLQPTGR